VTINAKTHHIRQHIYLGLARTIYIRCVYGNFGREITIYTVIYGVYIYTVLANPKYIPTQSVDLGAHPGSSSSSRSRSRSSRARALLNAITLKQQQQ
jgi:hypothetical protein